MERSEEEEEQEDVGRNEREERAVTKRLYKTKLALVLLHSLSQTDENA